MFQGGGMKLVCREADVLRHPRQSLLYSRQPACELALVSREALPEGTRFQHQGGQPLAYVVMKVERDLRPFLLLHLDQAGREHP
jgi:hypothetical protein